MIEIARVFDITPSDLLPIDEWRTSPALLRAVAQEVDSASLAAELERFTHAAEQLPPLVQKYVVRPASPRDTAERLLSIAGLTGPPVDIKGLVRDCGVHIVAGQFSDIDALVLALETGAAIYINRQQAETRQRFSLAHELGHHLLRHVEHFQLDLGGDLGPNAIGEHPSYDWRLERQANDFAANLLMPAQWVRDCHADDPRLRSLARQFNVSQAAMGFRLKHLGLD